MDIDGPTTSKNSNSRRGIITLNLKICLFKWKNFRNGFNIFSVIICLFLNFVTDAIIIKYISFSPWQS